MNIQLIDPKLIKPNPWQSRLDMDPAAIAELAESITAQGLLQPPVARSLDGRYELAFGHRRLRAWRSAKPGEPMPLQVQELSDRQMAEYAATENAARQDLNPIERAQAMKRLMAEFQMTQSEVGKLFGLASQGAASNAMRLLKLPAEVQQLLVAGQLAERQARALLPLAHTPKPQLMSTIAAHLARLNEGERDEALENELWQAVHKVGQSLDGDPWPAGWPEKPIQVDRPNTKLGEPGEVPACKACPFLCRVAKREFCLRPSCHGLKLRLFAAAEAQRASKHLGIGVAAPGEKVAILVGEKYTGYEENDKYKALVKIAAAREHLRLVPADRLSERWDRKAVTGSEMVMLGTVNRAALERLQPAKEKTRSNPRIDSYRRQQKAMEARALECKRLCLAAAPHFARIMPENAELLALLMERFSGSDQTHAKDMQAFKAAEDKRAVLARMVLLSAVPHWRWSTEATPGKALKKISGLAGRLKIKLPRGWDVKPEAPKKGKKR